MFFHFVDSLWISYHRFSFHQAPGNYRTLSGNCSHGHHPRPSPLRTTDPDMGLGSSLCPNVPISPSDSTDHPDQLGPACDTIWHRHGLRWPTRPWPSSWPSMTTGAPNINSDPGCYRATDPGRALCSSLGPNDTVALSDNTDHSDPDVSSGNMAFRHPPGHRLGPDPGASLWLLVPMWTMNINTDAGCGI